ncbi:MAG: TIGR00266 family protein [Oscillatoria sp. SIO1A7]|nr:TIGR00266 family protein [Oscillatoria sp. SIO1A7]
MDIEILQQPDSAIARVTLSPGEEAIAEAGAMIAMNGFVQATTTLRQGKAGGLAGGFKRMLAGESFFLSKFQSPHHEAEIFLAPKFLGDLIAYEMTRAGLVVQASSYLASSANVDIDLGFQGFKSLFSGESIFWLDLSGQGQVLLSSFGAIYEIPVDGEYIVDTGHIVAFEKSLIFEITKPPGSNWVSAWLGGEGLVCRFKGRGRLFCQTHNASAFGRLIGSQMPAKSK